MASTYSTLKIQLMATGENSGTWGTVTNTNLGTALEEAIVGSADVTFASANQTLTLTDTNATQTARNLRLNLTGTTGGVARTLTVPAIEKIYIVNNGCADTVTIQNATGTGIAVPAGKTLFVYNNGTNVVDAVTHLTSLTLASALPIASGGTGSTTATFSGANITSLNANNISSGVLAVAQGGTGSATATFSGANITSLNANNISAGQLATARGGTNLTTFTAANNAIYSTSASVLAAGTLPIEAGGTGSTTATFSGANITSLNANNISTGQLATARGGTNLTGFTAANNAIYSTSSSALTAGTLPITAGGTGSTTATFSGANITSLNASNISAGTLAAARLGTAEAPQFSSLGIGTAASGVSGEIRATNNVTAYYTSDRKFKENIRDIDGALEKVSAIGGKYFNWTKDYIKKHGGADGYFVQENDFGVIAQDVHNVFPVAVRTKEDGSLAVDYEKLCALAFAAIKELVKRVEVLENK